MLLTLFDPIRDFGQGERVFLFMSAVADQALQNYTKGQSIGFHVKNYVKVEMSPSLGGKNCSLTRNVFFPISRLLMSEKIHVAYAQERHASDFYLYILKTWSGLELSRLFSINAVSLVSRASKVQAEVPSFFNTYFLICVLQSQKECENEPFPPSLPWVSVFDLRKCQIMPNGPKCFVCNVSSRTHEINNMYNTDTSDTGLNSWGDDASFVACINRQMDVDMSHTECLLRK